MTATHGGPRQAIGGDGEASAPEPVRLEEPEGTRNGHSVTDRNLQARSSNRVYQAAGNQYIYDHPAPAPAAVTNTLPRDTAAFTGRDRELRRLIETVRTVMDNGGLMPVYAIDGMPGVGKSALAVHAAHLLAQRFPDGQFFVDLHAHSPHNGPVRPADALHGLLSADGMDVGQIPADHDARTALWRSRMAGKRALIVLDNAAGREQVEPLLPGAAGCLVMITSRRRLTGLSARHAAVPLTLGTMSPAHAAELFGAMAGRPVLSEKAAATAELVSLCGHLPLAICLLAAKLRPEPQWRVSDLLRELAQPNHRLAYLRAEDVGVQAAFDLSYRMLSTSLKRLFRRLGLHPGPDFDRYAAAALDGGSPEQAQRQLDALYHDHLLDQPIRGRYRMHDLIKEYARDRVDAEPARGQAEAITRLLTYYRRAAERADRRLRRPGQQPPGTATPASDGLPIMQDRRQALAWLDAERANLFACATLAPARSQGRVVIALAAATASYLRSRGPWQPAIALHEAAADIARQVEDPLAYAGALRELGALHRLSGNYPSATDALCRALELYRQCADSRGAADTLIELAGVRRLTGDDAGAGQDLEQALAGYAELADLPGQARALNELVVVRHQAGKHAAAINAQQQALAIYLELGDLNGRADVLNQLGGSRQLVNDYKSAIEAHKEALDLYRELGDRRGQARALNYLGAALGKTADYAGAEQTLTEALALHRELGYRLGQANALNYLATVRRARGDYPAAEQALGQALALYRELGYQEGEIDVLNQLGVIARLRGDREAASNTHHEALALARQLGNPLSQAEVLNELGRLRLTENPSQALQFYRKALQLARRADNLREEGHALDGIAQCVLRLGDLHRTIGRPDQAQ